MNDVIWIVAPTSGIAHVAGVGYDRQVTIEGTRLLCGWVIVPAPKSRAETTGKKCKGCSAWLKKIEEGHCPKRDDETHCVHWWDGEGAKCCSCGAG